MKKPAILLGLLALLPLTTSAATYTSAFPSSNINWNQADYWTSSDPEGTYPSTEEDIVIIDHTTEGSNRGLRLNVDVDLASVTYSANANNYLQFTSSGSTGAVRIFKAGTFTRTNGSVQFSDYDDSFLKVEIGDLTLGSATGNIDIGAGRTISEFTVTGTTKIGGFNATLQNSGKGTITLGHLDIASGGRLWTSGRSQNGEVVVSSLVGSGRVAVQNSPASNTATRGDLRINSTNTTPVTFSGILEDGNNNGRLHITKQGSGDQQLSNSNTYTGTTSILGGRLILTGSGSINATEKITLNGGELHTLSSTTVNAPVELIAGTISGSGTVAAALTVGNDAVLAPGVGTGTQSFVGNQNWESGGTLALQLSLASEGVSNRLMLEGALDLTALSAGERFTISLAGWGTGDAFQPDQDAQWTVATTTGGIALDQPMTDLFTFSGDEHFTPVLHGFTMGLDTTETQLILHYQAIPEPALWWIGAAGLALGVHARRKKT